MSSGKCKLKQQWDTTTHLLEWPKSKTFKIPNAGEDVEQQKVSLLVGMQNGTATLEDSLADSYKTKHTLTKQSSNHMPWYVFKGLENFMSTQNLPWMFIAASVIITKTWKQPRCPSVCERINSRQGNIIQC